MRSHLVIAKTFLARAALARAEVHAALYCAARLDDVDSLPELEAALADAERLVAMAQRAVADAEAQPSASTTLVEARVLALLKQHGPHDTKDIGRKLHVRSSTADAAVTALVRAGHVVSTPQGIALAG